MRKSQLAILAALNSKPKDPEPVGWFRPNDPRLVPTLRGVIASNKGIAATPASNGFIFLYAVEQTQELDPMKHRHIWGAGPLVGIDYKPPQRGTDLKENT